MSFGGSSSNSNGAHIFNEQWLTFILGLFFLIPFLVGVILPFLKVDNRFPTLSYQIGFCFNTVGFIAYIVGIIFVVQVLHKDPSDVIASINSNPTSTPSSYNATTNSTHGHLVMLK